MKLDIQNTDKKFEWAKIKFENMDISEQNKETVKQFEHKCFMLGMSKSRVLRYYNFFFYIFKFFKKDLLKTTKEDIEFIVSKMNANENHSPVTKCDNRCMLKRFYKLMEGNNENYPQKVVWISTKIRQCDKKLIAEGDLLTKEEIKTLIEATLNIRDKAFVALLAEGGFRIAEIGNLLIGNIKFEDLEGKTTAIITVTGKTGMRKVRVVQCVTFLRQYLEKHPFKSEDDKPLWITLGKQNKYIALKPLKYDNFRMLVKRAFLRAGIKKRSNLHLFRHSRATHMASVFSEFEANTFFGWVQGSGMPSTYIHLSGKDLDKKILAINGIHTEPDKQEEIIITTEEEQEKQEFLKWKEEKEFKKWKEMKNQGLI